MKTPQKTLQQIVADFLEAYRNRGERPLFCVAFSGGSDSTALLHVLKELREEKQDGSFSLAAVHVNHQIRAGAAADEAFCADLCQAWEIPLKIVHIQGLEIAAKEKLSLEEACRKGRYEAFEAYLQEQKKPAYLLLAHHQMDQAETVLLNLLRGSGSEGLSGMALQRGPYLRPLLNCSKELIMSYLEEHHLSFCEDETNQDAAYMRNRIRRELMEVLARDYNPRIVETLSRTAKILREENEYLTEQTRDAYEECLAEVKEEERSEGERLPTLSCSRLLALPLALSRRVLRMHLQQWHTLQDVEEEHIGRLLELAGGRSGRKVSLLGGLTVEKSYDILIFRDSARALPQRGQGGACPYEVLTFRRQDLTDQEWLAILQKAARAREIAQEEPKELYLCIDQLEKPPEFRLRREGDYLLVRGPRKAASPRMAPEDPRVGKEAAPEKGAADAPGLVRKRLKAFFIDEKVPGFQRDRLWLLASGSFVLWIPGVRISEGLTINPKAQTILYVRRKNA